MAFFLSVDMVAMLSEIVSVSTGDAGDEKEPVRMCHCGGVDEDSRVEELEATIRSLRDEVERLKAEISRLRRDRDERPPHYL